MNYALFDLRPVLRQPLLELVALIARLTLPVEAWPEFWPAMFELASNGDNSQRLAVLQVVEELGDKIFDYIRPMADDWIAFSQACLDASQEANLRIAAMKAAGVIMGEVQEETDELVPKLRPLVPLMLDVIQACVQHGADEHAIDGLNIFQAMVETCPSILSPHVSGITQFCLVTASNVDIDWEIRSECLTFLQWVIQFRPSFVTKQGLLDPILTVCFNVAAEPQMEGIASWEITPHRFSLQVIDCVARYIKPKYTFDNLMARVDEWMPSPNPWQRRAAVGALSAMPNGCCVQMLPAIPQLLPYLQAAFDDQDPFVRQAGCILLGQFADFLNPDITQYHEECLPLAYRAMCEEDPEIQERALYSLITFLEHLTSIEVDELLDQIMHRLVTILESSGNKDIQDMAISAISSVASVSLQKFAPYWAVVTRMMEQLMHVTQPEMLSLRARALDCVGVIALSVGKETFGPYFDFFMTKALEGFNMTGVEATELREFALNFFGNTAEALQQDFRPYFETCLNLILDVLSNTDGDKPEFSPENLAMAQLMVDSDDDEDEKINRALPSGGGDGDEDDDNDLPDELSGLKYITNQGMVDEKTVALQTLGVFAHAMGAEFVPHIPRCMQVLELTGRMVHPKVRSFTVYPIESFAICLNQTFPAAQKWTPGAPPEQFPLNPSVQEFVDAMIPSFIKKVMVDFDLGVVSRLLESFSIIVNTLGAPAIHHHMPALGTAILEVFRSKTTAHAMETDEGDGENEEIAQELLMVFDHACEFVVALAKAYTTSFGQWFLLLEELIVHLATDEEEPSVDDGSQQWRQEAVGTLAETVDACSAAAFSPEQIHILLAQAIKCLSDPHESTRSNAVYLSRLIAVHPASYDWWSHILSLVVPLLSAENDQVVDNANGCIAAMIAHNASLIPMEEILPEWLAAFPCRIDQIEAGIAYGTLLSLIEHNNQDLFPHIPQVFKVLVDTLGSPVVTDETRAQIQNMVRSLWAQYSNELQPVLETLEPDNATNLQTTLQEQPAPAQ